MEVKMRGRIGYSFVTAILILCGCTKTTQSVAVASAPAVEIPAAGETVAVATQNADAADDPAAQRGIDHGVDAFPKAHRIPPRFGGR